jgi:two-component system, chemotaxis family, CheB/CheR fusion protein
MTEHSGQQPATQQRGREAAPFIVGIGASAGGIEALRAFFARVNPDSGAAYVVILHLSPDHDSQLAQVLQNSAPIPVTQVREHAAIEPNHVYVVPPNRVLSVDRESIAVADVTRPEQRRAPVDLFFRSLADAQGSRAVCVILSGTGPNGSSGLKRIKEYGGLVIAQDPDEAQHGDMPRNAIATGLVDVVLPVAEMPTRIHGYHDRMRQDGDDTAASRPTASDPDAMHEILTVLRVRTGHDFSNYKPGTIQRRVERRIHLRNLSSLASYARAIKENPDEAVALMRELLISVTNFFRDAQAWNILAQRVIPRIFMNKSGHDQIRVWVPGCATGEEAYSIAILLAEYAATSVEQPALQVFATDLDQSAVAIAREAFYSNAEVADVSEERLKRFFTREPNGYRVRRDLRETVLVAHHNVIKDPPFSHLDLISCRNLLIYLNRSVQERVVDTFHFALRPGAFLFLGASESPDGSQDLFTVSDKTAHIYESRAVTTRVMIPLGDSTLILPRPALRTADARAADRLSPGELHQRLLERYAPPSIVVTDEHNVVHLSERATRYLQVAPGEPTRDVLKMVRSDLRPDLRTAMHQATRERRTVEVNAITAALEDGIHQIDLIVHPVLRDSDPVRGYLLLLFEEHDRATPPAEGEPQQLKRAADTASSELEEEIARLKLQLRTTIEQYETQAEEAKASNEELQAMNEELRSAAEELETSKEELQSVNEELTTVNQELKIKIEELGLTNNDFQNLINSSEIGTIFLDRTQRVKLSTPAANEIFNLLRADVGRPLSDITSNLMYERVHEDAQQVLDHLQTIDREIPTRDGGWVYMRLRPYRTTDDRIDGVVITFQDVTERRRAEERVRQGEERLRLLVDGATDYAIFTMTSDGVIDSWNLGAERMFGYTADSIVGKHFEVLFTAEDRAGDVPHRELLTAQESGRAADERFHVRRDGSRFYCSGTTIRLGETLGFAKIARDLSVQQQAAEALRVVQADFESRVRERTGVLEAEVQARSLAHEHVSSLLSRIVTAQEDERARIARDLHDQLGQQLTALRLALQRQRERGSTDEIEQALTLTQQIDHQLDFLSWQLRPAVLDDVGLGAALPLFVREWSAHYRIAAEYQAGGYSEGKLGRDAELVFYRVAQEALNNIVKHAHASRVDVLLEARDGNVVLVIEDDGIGFDVADRENRDKGIGIVGMQERASLIGATLDLESKPGEGTAVYLRIPLSGQ